MSRVALVLSVSCLTLFSFSLSKVQRSLCPTNVVAKQGTDMRKLAGTWIQYGKYGLKLKKTMPLCSRYEFGEEVLDDALFTETRTYKYWKSTRSYKLHKEADGRYDVQPNRDEDIALSIEERRIAEEKRRQKKKNTLFILDTDYDCWVITYQCKENRKRIQYSVIKMTLLLKNTDACMKEEYKANFQFVVKNRLLYTDKTPRITWLITGGCATK